jgi:hypothetical protein
MPLSLFSSTPKTLDPRPQSLNPSCLQGRHAAGDDDDDDDDDDEDDFARSAVVPAKKAAPAKKAPAGRGAAASKGGAKAVKAVGRGKRKEPDDAPSQVERRRPLNPKS